MLRPPMPQRGKVADVALARQSERVVVGAMARLTPLMSVVGALLVWEFLARLLPSSQRILPAPSAFLASLIDNAAYLGGHSLITLQAIAVGFAVGVALAIPLGFVIGLSPVLERSLYYAIVLINTLPKVALAPLLVVWFGHGLASKVVLIAIGAFVPVLVDSIAGFKYLDQRLLYVSKSAGASFLQTLGFIRIPAALPHIVAGLRTSLIIAVTVAIVVEYVAATDGLGFAAMRGVTNDDVPLVFAAITVGTVIGFIVNAIMDAVEWLALPWKRR
jgi:NitT/TauT family transport system permease protein